MRRVLLLALLFSACGLKAPPVPPSHEPPLTLKAKTP